MIGGKVKRVLDLSAVALIFLFLIGAYWKNICYAYGQTNAALNIMSDRRITYNHNMRFLRNDTMIIADSLIFTKYGYEEIETFSGCLKSRSWEAYKSGYTSIYNFHLEKKVFPKYMDEARRILKSRPADWQLEIFRKRFGKDFRIREPGR